MSRVSGPNESVPCEIVQDRAGDVPPAATVQVSESRLSQVAQRLGVPAGAMAAANPNLPDHNRLKAGQELNLPPDFLSGPSEPEMGQSDEASRKPSVARLDLAVASRIQKSMLAARLDGGSSRAKMDAGTIENASALPLNRRNGLESGLDTGKQLLNSIIQENATLKNADGPVRKWAERAESKLNRLADSLAGLESSLKGTSLPDDLTAAKSAAWKQLFTRVEFLDKALQDFKMPDDLDLPGYGIDPDNARLPGGDEATESDASRHSMQNLENKMKNMYEILSTMLKNFHEMQQKPIQNLR